jgi:hypothetical protein
LGQLSSAILEFETVLQRHPDDKEAAEAMAQIESKADNLTCRQPETETTTKKGPDVPAKKGAAQPEVDDGRQTMFKHFVEAKVIAASDFDACWPVPSLTTAPAKTVEPFIHNLAERKILPVEQSLKILAERSRLAFLPLDRYEVDQEVLRGASREICQRWCVVPFDRMSKTTMVATANPFNKQAVADMEDKLRTRLLWYLATPQDLLRLIAKVLR